MLCDPPSDADLLVYTTRGLGPAYKELVTTLRTRDSVIHFEELFGKIVDHEGFLLHNEKQYSEPSPPTVHFLNRSSNFHQNKRTTTSGLLPTPKGVSPSNRPSQLLCQYCDKRGHDAKQCFKLFPHLRTTKPAAHFTIATSSPNAP